MWKQIGKNREHQKWGNNMINVNEARLNQLNYIGITEADIKLLEQHKSTFEHIVSQLVDTLYDKIAAVPNLKAIIEKYSTFEKLKRTQQWYFTSFTDGVIDDAYINKRIHVGSIHSRIGLSSDWYLGTYIIYLDLATYHFKQTIPNAWQEVVHALSKMFNFDSQLVLESYEQHERRRLEELNNNQANILKVVTEAILELTNIVNQIKQSSEVLDQASQSAMRIQQKTEEEVQSLNEQVEKINEVSQMIQQVADQSHLIGLNASIEAAHAGEAGRGFEVVANEVRKLASLTKNQVSSIDTNLDIISQAIEALQNGIQQSYKHSQEQVDYTNEMVSFVNVLEVVAKKLEAVKEG